MCTQKEAERNFRVDIVLWLGKIYFGLPVLFGILLPMAYLAPLIFSSWLLFSPHLGHGSWMTAYIYFGRPVSLAIFTVGIFLFVLGLVMLSTGLIALVNARKNHSNLTKVGPYRYLRHPQNFGIFLMLAPLVLRLEIRLGEIQSWMLVGILFALTSLLEEYQMVKKLGLLFESYLTFTGFFLPRFRQRKWVDPKMVRKKRYFLKMLIGILLWIPVSIMITYALFLLCSEFGHLAWVR